MLLTSGFILKEELLTSDTSLFETKKKNKGAIEMSQDITNIQKLEEQKRLLV
tara:strand:+ start:33908 stop:34063 length:156 start_codon:yes stop_codon:yes gene_type:complete